MESLKRIDETICGTNNLFILLQVILISISSGLTILVTDVFMALLLAIVLIILFYLFVILGVDSKSSPIMISYVLASITSQIMLYSAMVAIFVLMLTSDDVSQYGIRNLDRTLFMVIFGILAFLWSLINLLSIILTSTLMKLLNQRDEIEHQTNYQLEHQVSPVLPFPPPYHIYVPRPTYGWQVVEASIDTQLTPT
jgi:hypothetical protein